MAATPQRLAIHQRAPVRFGASLLGNGTRGALGVLNAVILARVLGASGYGSFNYLLTTFTALGVLLDCGSSSAFYTFIARRSQSRAVLGVYFAWLSCQMLLPAAVLLFIPAQSHVWATWVQEPRGRVLVAFFAAFLSQQVWTAVGRLGEALRETVWVQLWGALRAGLHTALIVVAWRVGSIGVTAVFWLLIGEYLLVIALVAPHWLRANLAAGSERDGESWRDALRRYWRYSRPLALVSGMSFAYTLADRWWLEYYSGPRQQGFFSIAQQFSAILLLVTTSLLNVFWKEIADAFEQGQNTRLRRLYERAVGGLFGFSAWLACGVIPFSREITAKVLGPHYVAAWPTVALMFLYPVHQCLGQVDASFMFAVGQTRAYARVGIATMLASIGLAYWLLAPPSAPIPGLHSGAVGLAIKYVAIQIVAVNLYQWAIARHQGWPFLWKFQFLCVPWLAVSWGCKAVFGALLPDTGSNFWAIVALTAAAYVAASWSMRRATLRWLGLEMPEGILSAAREYRRALTRS
jgi:O-antigen/teichoic acid export membrane protein